MVREQRGTSRGSGRAGFGSVVVGLAAVAVPGGGGPGDGAVGVLGHCQVPGLVEAEFSRLGGLPDVLSVVVETLVLDGWDQPELAV